MKLLITKIGKHTKIPDVTRQQCVKQLAFLEKKKKKFPLRDSLGVRQTSSFFFSLLYLFINHFTVYLQAISSFSPIPTLTPPPPIFPTSPERRGGPPHPGYQPTLLHQVAAGLNTSSPTEARTFLFLVLFFRTVLLCRPVWPQTHLLPASDPPVLGLQTCAII